MPASAHVFAAMTERLQRAGLDVRDSRESYDAARETRDTLIVEASDQGMPQRAIARACLLTQQRVTAIVLERTGVTETAAS